jgi:DNA polymerase epsilon subunit 2
MNRPQSTLAAANPIPSSSPAFGTPVHPINPRRAAPIPPPQLKPATILPISLPPPTLRPLAFRTFTKKHNLTLTSSALAALAAFIGRHCGSGWREDGLAEGVLEETAKMWKKQNGGVIVDGDGEMLRNILKTLDGCMSGGRVLSSKTGLSRQTSFAFADATGGDFVRPGLNSHDSFGISRLDVRDTEDEDEKLKDPRDWLKVIGAFDQPRLVYNVTKKHFDKYASHNSAMRISLTATDQQQRPRSSLHPRTKQSSFVNAFISSINASSAMRTFRLQVWQANLRPTKSHQSPTCSVGVAAPISFLVS